MLDLLREGHGEKIIDKYSLGFCLNEHIDYRIQLQNLPDLLIAHLVFSFQRLKLCGGMPFDCLTTLYESLVRPFGEPLNSIVLIMCITKRVGTF